MKKETLVFRHELEIEEVDRSEVIYSILKGHGFVKDNMNGKVIFMKGFTFVLIDETKAKITVGKKQRTETKIIKIVIGSDVAKNKMRGKGVNINPENITDFVAALNYFKKMEAK